jgi:hypothetical protein
MRRIAVLILLLAAAVLSAACSRAAAGEMPTAAVAAVLPTPELATPGPTPTLIPSPTAAPSATPTPTPLPTATVPPTATPAPTGEPAVAVFPTPPTLEPALLVNGIPFYEIAVMPPEVEANVREIFAKGQALGRNPRAFSKVGDSLTLTRDYMAKFDQGRYNLGPYQQLQPAIDHYAGSFARFGVAARNGLHAWTAFAEGDADPSLCAPDESMVECEVRLHNPSVLLIRLGTNDVAPGEYYENAMRFAVEFSIERGIIPVLGTKADRFEGDNRNNEVLRRLAAEYGVPVWDFDVVAGTLPNRGLGQDNVHLTATESNDYTRPDTFQAGYPVNDLTALFMLDMIRRATATSG